MILPSTEAIKQFIANKKNRGAIFGLVIAAALLFAVPLFNGGGAKEAAAKADSPGVSAREYKEELTKELEWAIAQIDGVGQVSVVVMMAAGIQNVYADEEKTSKTQSGSGANAGNAAFSVDRKALVVRDGNGGENPVLLQQIEPQISGILVICDGGDREGVVYRVTNSLKSLLGVPSNRISVVKRRE